MTQQFDKDGFALRDLRVKVYQYAEDGELVGSRMEHVAKGTGIPANSTFVNTLTEKDGFTQVFNIDKQQWEYIEDYRYSDVYNIHTKQREDIRYIGQLSAEHTLLEPPSIYHEFTDGGWILTEEQAQALEAQQKAEQQQQLQTQLNDINSEIAMLERFAERSDAEEDRLQNLIEESQRIYREMNQ